MEGLEYMLQLSRVHAATGIGNCQFQMPPGCVDGAKPRLQAYFTVAGKLAGVAQQVMQYLMHAAAVQQQQCRKVPAGVINELVALRCCQLPGLIDHRV